MLNYGNQRKIRMDKRQYYLQKIAEEALEVATAAMKCIQFGNDSRDPNDPDSLSNIDHLVYEINDLNGSFLCAYAEDILRELPNFNHEAYVKANKIDKYYDLCVKLGTVKED